MNKIQTMILGSLISGGILWYAIGVRAPSKKHTPMSEEVRNLSERYEMTDLEMTSLDWLELQDKNNHPSKLMKDTRQNEANKLNAKIKEAESVLKQFSEKWPNAVNNGYRGFPVHYPMKDNEENNDLYIVRIRDVSNGYNFPIYYAVGDPEISLAYRKAEAALDQFIAEKEAFDSEVESFNESVSIAQEKHDKSIAVAKDQNEKAESYNQITAYLTIIAILGLWTFCPPFRFLVLLIAGVCTMGYFQNR